MRAIIFALAVISLAACSQQPSPSQQATNELPTPDVQVTSAPTHASETPAATVRPPAEASSELGVGADDLDGVSIDFWHIWSWESGQALEDLVNEFNITNPYGIRAEAVNQESYSDLSKALDDALRFAEGPNLTIGFNNQLLALDQDWSVVRDLNDYIDDPVWGLTQDELDDFYPQFWTQDTADGKRLGLPAQRSAQLLFYNLTWAEELGFDAPPKNLSEFRNQGCRAANQNREDENPENDGTGGWVIDTSTATVFSWVAALGGDIENSSGYTFNIEPVEETFAFLKQLFDEGCGWLSQNRFPNSEFASRRALFISSSTAGIPFQEEAFIDSGSTDVWAGIPFPSDEEAGVVGIFGPSFTMIKSAPEEELATWLLIKWLLEPKNQARWIRASGHLPSRGAVLDELVLYVAEHPQWADALELLPQAASEPSHASWGVVRWTLSDAADQVFRLGLTADQLPALLEELEDTAEELHARFE